MTTLKERDAQASITRLKELLVPGDTVYTVVTHVSRSGMLRHIKPLINHKGEMVNVSWDVSRALDWPMNKDHDAVEVDGCGMDMGFHLVYSLSYALFRDLNQIDSRQQSGYLLNQRWL
jgi:hypothetical protein